MVGTTDIVWIGFNDITTEGTFVWNSGETWSYTNWGPGEPDNWGTPGDCGNLTSYARKWADGACGAVRPFVCEAP